jgi:hypothetical protein
VRHTAGAISALFGLLLILPLLAEALPDSWAQHIVPYLPSNAGARIMNPKISPGDLATWRRGPASRGSAATWSSRSWWPRCCWLAGTPEPRMMAA